MRRLCCRGSCEPKKKQNTMDAFFCVSRCWRSAPTIPHRIGVSDWHLFSFFFCLSFFFFKKQKWHGFDETALCRHLLQLPTQVFTSGDVGADALDFLLLKSSRRVRKEMSWTADDTMGRSFRR